MKKRLSSLPMVAVEAEGGGGGSVGGTIEVEVVGGADCGIAADNMADVRSFLSAMLSSLR